MDALTIRDVPGGIIIIAPDRFPMRFCTWCEKNVTGPHLCQRRPAYVPASATTAQGGAR